MTRKTFELKRPVDVRGTAYGPHPALPVPDDVADFLENQGYVPNGEEAVKEAGEDTADKEATPAAPKAKAESKGPKKAPAKKPATPAPAAGDLPPNLLRRKVLIDAGLTTRAKVLEHEDLTQLEGIDQEAADKIKVALGA